MKTIYTTLTLSDSKELVAGPQSAAHAQIELIWTKEDAKRVHKKKKKLLHFVRRKANGFEIY